MWVTDITYIRTWEAWLYLAVVTDLFSRMIIGWATASSLHRRLVLDAVLRAVRRRRPRETIIHSDQGCQYVSGDWRRFSRTNRLQPSMSQRRNCWNNAEAESAFASLRRTESRSESTRTESSRSRMCPTTSTRSTIASDATPIWAASARKSLNQRATRVGRVSTKSWELHSPMLLVGRTLADLLLGCMRGFNGAYIMRSLTLVSDSRRVLLSAPVLSLRR